MTACGFASDTSSIIHAVLLVEQMLTTGGGWQDQVGGLLGGIKVGRSKAKLPLRVTNETLVTSSRFYATFADHLELVYTGQPRLARNLLQNVIRNYYTKQQVVVRNFHDIRENAEQCAEACKREDLKAIGHHINRCWCQKKLITSGCEQQKCAKIIAALAPYALGQALAGVGGGGFLYVLTTKPYTKEFIASALSDEQGAQNITVYNVEIDKEGMVFRTAPVN
ncbi:unnamed protein product [Clavelina lepadiformis]|uniref:GHMP kinase C-terminal domain-containing protein n=1 Tax=Clavelina lepadiformis TaxID=159417 RepID=A0ABP0FXF2_CLALP